MTAAASGSAATRANQDLLRRLGIATHAPRTHLLLALADDDLVTGHVGSRLAATAGDDPDGPRFVALATAVLGHAAAWLRLLAPDASDEQVAGTARALALGRPAAGYTHAVACEVRPRSFAHQLARHWLHEHAIAVRLVALAGSTDAPVAATARELLAARRGHLDHATTWVSRFARADGGPELLARGLRDELPLAFELFEEVVDEADAVATGLLPLPHAVLLRQWLELMVPALEALGIDAGEDSTRVLPEDLGPPDFEGALDLVPTDAGRRGAHTRVWTEQLWPELAARAS